MNSSVWVRFCRACGKVVDGHGSCQSCEKEGPQPGHYLCNGQQEEAVECAFTDLEEAREREGECACGRIRD
jgi:hypothetical protein